MKINTINDPSKIHTSTYLDKLYGGWLGKLAGVRHGANIEGMTFEQIREKYGELHGYPVDFKRFAADDDTNGPTFFIRALSDYNCSADLSAEDIGKTWLNYAPFGHGFYWWGGYGISTEHTAYLNLRSGAVAPLSGSKELNGATLAEQIGGQIFIDCWGLVAPGNPELAASLAARAASVSHDGEGIWGGVFIASCISLAFVSDDIPEIIREARERIPCDSAAYEVIGQVAGFHSKNPTSWQDCFVWIKENHGYDKYPGFCPILPNLAVVVLALLYGEGDFADTVNICSMCGWDTDCNSGNAGTIVGVVNGAKRLPRYWPEPFNDQYVCSSVMGSMNIVDVPSFVYYLASLAYTIGGAKIPDFIKKAINPDGLFFDFSLPYSRHGIHVRTSNGIHTRTSSGAVPVLSNHNEKYPDPEKPESKEDSPCLVIGNWAAKEGDRADCFFDTYFTPADFDDNRSNPAFSPILYPGAEITAELGILEDVGTDPAEVEGSIYVETLDGRMFRSGWQRIGLGGTMDKIRFRIPFLDTDAVARFGLSLALVKGGLTLANADHCDTNRICPTVRLFSISTREHPDYTLDFSRMKKQVWTPEQSEIDQFTRLKGSWDLLEGQISGTCDDFGEIYSGHHLWSDYSVSATVVPAITRFAGLNCRVQGAIRSYALALVAPDRIAFFKNDNGYTVLQEKPFPWKCGESYRLRIDAAGNKFSCYCNDDSLFTVTDDKPYRTGCVGFSIRECGRTLFENLSVRAIG